MIFALVFSHECANHQQEHIRADKLFNIRHHITHSSNMRAQKEQYNHQHAPQKQWPSANSWQDRAFLYIQENRMLEQKTIFTTKLLSSTFAVAVCFWSTDACSLLSAFDWKSPRYGNGCCCSYCKKYLGSLYLAVITVETAPPTLTEIGDNKKARCVNLLDIYAVSTRHWLLQFASVGKWNGQHSDSQIQVKSEIQSYLGI